MRNGDEYYNVIIGYLCIQFEGDIIPDMKEVWEATFFNLSDLPDKMSPTSYNKIDISGGLNNGLEVKDF